MPQDERTTGSSSEGGERSQLRQIDADPQLVANLILEAEKIAELGGKIKAQKRARFFRGLIVPPIYIRANPYELRVEGASRIDKDQIVEGPAKGSIEGTAKKIAVTISTTPSEGSTPSLNGIFIYYSETPYTAIVLGRRPNKNMLGYKDDAYHVQYITVAYDSKIGWKVGKSGYKTLSSTQSSREQNNAALGFAIANLHRAFLENGQQNP